MRSLHLLHGTMSILVTAAVYGRRGPLRLRGWTQRHIYRVERGTPPPQNPNEGAYGGRRNWRPYGQRINARQPLCGRLVTTAENPHANPDYYYTEAQLRVTCPACITAAAGSPVVQHHETIIDDPWTSIPHADRAFTPDPVSGL